MQILINYDPSVASAPPGFIAGITAAVDYLEKLFTNPISITINVGYGEVDGFQLGSNALGESYYPVAEPETYSAVVSALKAQAAPGASTLPTNSPFPAGYTLYLSPAEAKALGLPLAAPDGGVDGYVGFSSVPNTFSFANGSAPPANEYYFIGVVGHEISEIMGRVSLLDDPTPDYSIIDLYRYLSPGVRDITAGGFNSTAYFSINNGVTNLGSWNNDPNNGDLADWYPAGPAAGGNDAFNDYSNSGVINILSANDVTLMQALGWTTTTNTTTTKVISWANAVSGDFAVAANWSSGLVPGSANDVAISPSGTYIVSSSENETVHTLTTASGATLDITGGTFTITAGTALGVSAGMIQVESTATLVLGGDTSNTGRIRAPGGVVDLDNATISGGHLHTLGTTGLIDATPGTHDLIHLGATIVSGTVIDVENGSTLSIRGDTIGPGALVDVLSGGTVVLNGSVTSAGTLFASGVGSMVDITGALNDGSAEIGAGSVYISSPSSEAVVFQSSGIGGLLLANPIDYTGMVSGFGVNTSQFIDLTNVTYNAGESCFYTPNSVSPTQTGVLRVMNGGQVVAAINLLGDYTKAHFTLSADSSGHVKITDPLTGTVQLASVSGSTGAPLNALASAGAGPTFGNPDPHSSNGDLDPTHIASTVTLVGVMTSNDSHSGALIAGPYAGHFS